MNWQSKAQLPGGSKRRRPNRVSREEIMDIAGSGLTWRTSSLDTLFRRGRQWSPTNTQGSWSDLRTAEKTDTIRGNKWKEKTRSKVYFTDTPVEKTSQPNLSRTETTKPPILKDPTKPQYPKIPPSCAQGELWALMCCLIECLVTETRNLCWIFVIFW